MYCCMVGGPPPAYSGASRDQTLQTEGALRKLDRVMTTSMPIRRRPPLPCGRSGREDRHLSPLEKDCVAEKAVGRKLSHNLGRGVGNIRAGFGTAGNTRAKGTGHALLGRLGLTFLVPNFQMASHSSFDGVVPGLEFTVLLVY